MPNDKIVFLVPGMNAQGGVNNYYYTIKPKLNLNIEYVLRGPRNAPVRKILIFEIYRFLYDLLHFIFTIKNKNVKLIQISTSF